ncbi:MAG TPA: hypothetical protein VHX12_13975 [Acidisoma sp.]|nr:hypothetical protein [Acidisoma sp.]
MIGTAGPETSRNERGFALLLVLWALVLLSLIIGHLLAAGRQEAQLAANLRQATVAETVADSAVENTIYRLLVGSAPLSGRSSTMLSLPGGIAHIEVRDTAGLVNPNMAPPPLLSALLQECGASGVEASHLAQALIDWRSPNDDLRPLVTAYRAAGLPYAPDGQPFQSAAEVRLVVGMPPALADCLVPHLSVYSDRQIPIPVFADATVMHALMRMMRDSAEAPPDAPPDPRGPRAVLITAAGESGGARFVRQATVRIGGADPGHPYRILTWSDGT